MILILGKHGHVFPGEAPEIHAQEHFQHACTSQSHEQSWAGGRRRGRHRRYVSPLMFYLWISGEKSTSSLTVLIKMSKSDTFIVYYAYLKFEQRTFDFQILMERKKRRMQRMMMKMMKEMKLKRRERKMTGRITWGSERRCRDMKHHLLVFDLFFLFGIKPFVYTFLSNCVRHIVYLMIFFPFLFHFNHEKLCLRLDVWQPVAFCLPSQSLWTENRATPHFLTPTDPQQEEAI